MDKEKLMVGLSFVFGIAAFIFFAAESDIFGGDLKPRICSEAIVKTVQFGSAIISAICMVVAISLHKPKQ